MKLLSLFLSAFCLIATVFQEPAFAETLSFTVHTKPNDTRKYTCFKVVVNTQGTVPSAPGWTVCADPKPAVPREYTFKDGCLDATHPVTVTHTSSLGSTRATVENYAYPTPAGTKKWVGKCNDPIAYCVIEGGDTGTSFLGYSIPAGQYGYFYQMYPNAQNPTKVISASISLSAGAQAASLTVLSNTFPFSSGAGFDLEDLAVPPAEMPDGGLYEVVAYMEPGDATGSPGITPVWTLQSNVLTMDFSGSGGLCDGETSSIVAYRSPYPPAVQHGNLSVSYENGVDPPCTGLFVQDILAPEVPLGVPAMTWITLAGLVGSVLATGIWSLQRRC